MIQHPFGDIVEVDGAFAYIGVLRVGELAYDPFDGLLQDPLDVLLTFLEIPFDLIGDSGSWIINTWASRNLFSSPPICDEVCSLRLIISCVPFSRAS